MNLQLFLGYSYVGNIAIDPEAAINPDYLKEKKAQLETTYRDEIAKSKSRPLFYVEDSRQQLHNQKLRTKNLLLSKP
jgi:hypothetical protein